MNEPPGPDRQPLDIRKYPNRRYYDATHSRHLTLEEIRSLIRDGHDIKVTDSKSGADITAQVLTQIILELETPKLDSFPVPLLLRMIRANDLFVRDFIEKYFNQAFGAYLEYQKQVELRLRQMHQDPGAFSPFASWAQSVFGPFVPPFGPAQPQKPPGPPPPSSNPPADDQPELRRIIAELQEQVRKLQRGSPKAKRRRP